MIDEALTICCLLGAFKYSSMLDPDDVSFVLVGKVSGEILLGSLRYSSRVAQRLGSIPNKKRKKINHVPLD